MNLIGKWLSGEQQLEQERGIRGLAARSLVPNFADRFAVAAHVTPRAWIYDAPGL
jgi:hypothetical protein